MDAENSCTELGLQLLVWRSESHRDATIELFGIDAFKVVPGVFGATAGSFTSTAMNSEDLVTSTAYAATLLHTAQEQGAQALRIVVCAQVGCAGRRRLVCVCEPQPRGAEWRLHPRLLFGRHGLEQPIPHHLFRRQLGKRARLLLFSASLTKGCGPQCDFSTGERYICSTNDKGGFGTILRGM